MEFPQDVVEIETVQAGVGDTSAQPLMGPVTLYSRVRSLGLGFFICQGLSTLGSEVVAMKRL